MAHRKHNREKKTTRLRVAATIGPLVLAVTLAEQVLNLIHQLKGLW